MNLNNILIHLSLTVVIAFSIVSPEVQASTVNSLWTGENEYQLEESLIWNSSSQRQTDSDHAPSRGDNKPSRRTED
ncbi:MAG: hypothetical protein AAFO04_18455 [Cyanobacteria bacterium J06592_8]